jgi:hypothetical protein
MDVLSVLRKPAEGGALCAKVEGRCVVVESEGGRGLEGKVEFIGRGGAAESGSRWGLGVGMESINWPCAVSGRGG